MNLPNTRTLASIRQECNDDERSHWSLTGGSSLEGTTIGVGFPPAIMRSAAEIGLKSAVSNIPDKNKVQVLVSGSHNMITSFHQQIKNNDIRIKTNHKPKYNVTDAEDKPVDIFVYYKMDLGGLWHREIPY